MSQIEQTISNLSEQEAKDMLLNLVENTYVIVQWPESQDLMEKEWFDEEAILALGHEDTLGSSAFFVPAHRLL